MAELDRQPWENEIVSEALPTGAVLTAGLWMPVAGRALRNSPDDVVALTEDQVRSRLPNGDQLVLAIKAEDLQAHPDEDLARLLDSTDGGAIVIGVTYDLGNKVRVYNQICPECGSTDAELLGPADSHVAPGLRAAASLYQCTDCGTAWDA
ncbi:hypothetical protein [Mycolicibacterium iranicum]|uniref:Uncharacterized protein n=1 Tax=Mycolicibacterium iranicum TaxID=912594 RepID=A0A178LQA4_MYCIR|nr:hypothetical protein [Mycolicibacterium iranicum]OAN35133.1 hypothetical protein A4X20_26435 [Mycolicibacterium iranicum]